MIGIVTFHASHNHGSMLQAYATQTLLRDMGYESEMINFRMQSQKDYYALYQTKYGAMRFLRSLPLLPIHHARKQREKKFEQFLNTRYVLSNEEYQTYEDLRRISNKYDIYLSGSDQIWSAKIPEFVGSSIDYTGVYFLDFVDKEVPRISFSSSIGESTKDDLVDKKTLLMAYQAISTRESHGANILNELTGKTVTTVLDPTLMISSDHWRSIATREHLIDGDYIFLYTLKGIRPGLKWAKALTAFAQRHRLRVICVSPFFPIVYPGVKCLINVGPEEFLSLIDHASVVFTDSFHGTAFSINLNKPFYSLTLSDSQDKRKTELIQDIGLSDRVLHSYDAVANIKDYSISYEEANKIIAEKRYNSAVYLKKALEKASARV